MIKFLKKLFKRKPHIIYVCNRMKCSKNDEPCDSEFCFYTSDIEYAANFHKVMSGFYEENGEYDSK